MALWKSMLTVMTPKKWVIIAKNIGVKDVATPTYRVITTDQKGSAIAVRPRKNNKK